MIGIRLWREGSKGGGRAAAERLGSEIGIEDRGSGIPAGQPSS